MKLTPLTKEQAEHLAVFFKPLEHTHTFQVPATMDTLMVSDVTIAPAKGSAQDDFKYSIQTGVDLDKLIERYTGTNYTVLVIANILSVDNITLAQPYFFDIRELDEKNIKGFKIPEQL